MRRLIDLTKKVSNPFYLIRLTCEARADLQARKMFMSGFNGKYIFLKDGWENSKTLNLYSDASGNVGFAAVFGSWWFAKSWPSHLKEYQIAIKELLPIVVALELWGKHL